MLLFKFSDASVEQYFRDKGCHCDSRDWMKANGDPCEENPVFSFYQWIPYILLLQGCLFYLPKIVWGQFEDGMCINFRGKKHFHNLKKMFNVI